MPENEALLHSFCVFSHVLCALSARIETSQGQKSFLSFCISLQYLSSAERKLSKVCAQQTLNTCWSKSHKVNLLYAHIQLTARSSEALPVRFKRAETLCFSFVACRVPVTPHIAHGRYRNQKIFFWTLSEYHGGQNPHSQNHTGPISMPSFMWKVHYWHAMKNIAVKNL